MRVLLLNWKCPAHPGAGGAEVYTHEVLRRWAADGHDVTWFAAAVEGRPAREVVDGIAIVRAGGRLGVYAAARRFLRAHAAGFDVVVDEVNTRPFMAHRHAQGTPVVALVHQVADEIWHHETPLPVALLGRHVLEPRWLAAYRDVPTLTVSDSSAASLRARGLRDLAVVPEGIEGDPVDRVQKAVVPTVAFVGRLSASKRPLEVLAAVERARRAIPDLRLDVVGDGPLRAAVEAAAGPHVTVHGRVDGATRDRLVGRAHALLLASVREGWGLVVDEAALQGTHTIAYDRPGLRDSVPAAGGVLTTPTPAGLAAGITGHLPRLVAAPPASGWHAGAVGWDAVAEEVLRHVADHARPATHRGGRDARAAA